MNIYYHLLPISKWSIPPLIKALPILIYLSWVVPLVILVHRSIHHSLFPIWFHYDPHTISIWLWTIMCHNVSIWIHLSIGSRMSSYYEIPFIIVDWIERRILYYKGYDWRMIYWSYCLSDIMDWWMWMYYWLQWYGYSYSDSNMNYKSLDQTTIDLLWSHY